ncbi:SH3 domain-containing protein [Nitratireductor sp. CAU 1489]|uniref:SH3 domain-containing protein n=1 Tax=Nitratireductor arenosus TaxID=2682096 RepID=A0A844QJA9_9HYPH|nr:SH3 domain-containing protein [Nitratireductor arenosus]
MTRYTVNKTDTGGRFASSPFDEPITVFQTQPALGRPKGVALPALFVTVVVGAGLAIGIIAMSGEPTSAGTGAAPQKLALASLEAEPELIPNNGGTGASSKDEADDGPAATKDGAGEKTGAGEPETVAAVVASTGEEPLSKDNPRWAAMGGSVAAKAAVAVLAGKDDGAAKVSAPDTLAYVSDATKPALMRKPGTGDGAVETEAQKATDTTKPSEAALDADPAATPAAQGTGRITTAVNMRRGPDNGAGIVSVIPAGAKVGIVKCRVWCQVVHDGRTGYVFKRFVRQHAAASATSKKSAAAPQAAAETSELATLKSIHRGGR